MDPKGIEFGEERVQETSWPNRPAWPKAVPGGIIADLEHFFQGAALAR
jgi:hypothetical protein